jgi:hypothetical protein
MKTTWLSRALITGPHVTLVLSDKEFQAAAKHCRIPKADRGEWLSASAAACVHFFESPTGAQCHVVALRVDPKPAIADVLGLLVHESVHVWQAYTRYIGEQAPSDEFEAYSVQAISQRLIEEYLKRAKRRVKRKG